MHVTLSEVMEILAPIGGRVVNSGALGPALAKIVVEKPVPLSGSTSRDLAFFFSRHYENELPLASPGVLITGEEFVKPLEKANLPLWKKSAVVACADPYFAMALLSERFARYLSTVSHLSRGLTGDLAATRVHASAAVDPEAMVGKGVSIGPHCVVEAHARIGDETVIYPGCYVGERAVIGARCVLFPGVKIYEFSEIGDRVRIHAGSVIGADGFGYAPRFENGKIVAHQKIYHVGKVVIGDDVEIGANSCIDRATVGETRIERGAKLDNLVQVGHNAHVGEGSIICGGTCLAGSASLGKFVYIGGLSGISNQVQVGDGARVAADTLVVKDVPPGGTAVGNPQREYEKHFKAHALLNKLVAERESRRKSEREAGSES